MNEPAVRSLTRILRAAAMACALAYIGLYVVLALSRIGYPFELEWMEGGTVDHVRWILAGKPLYGAPSLEFIPYIYTPLYFYLSALVSAAIGVGFFPLRLVSFLSSLGILALIALLVRRETRGWTFPLIAAGVFAAAFRVSGAWLDIARVDSLALILLLLGAYVLLSGRSVQSAFLSGLFLGLSFLTKQSTLLTIGAMIAYALMADLRRGLVLLLTQLVLIGGSTLLLNALHHGWYNYYVFELPQHHPILPEVYIRFWTSDILPHLPIALGLGAAWFVLHRGRIRDRVFYPLFAAAMIGTSYVSRLHEGGYDNVLLPACVVLAILAGLGAHALARWAGHRHPSAAASSAAPPSTTTSAGAMSAGTGEGRSQAAQRPIPPAGARRDFVPALCFLVCIAQFGILVYRPDKQIPTKEDAAQGRRLIEIIREVDGEVLLPSHGYLAALAGKQTYAHGMAVADLLRGEKGDVRQRLLEEMFVAIRTRRFEAVLINLIRLRGSRLDYSWFPGLTDHYEARGRVFGSETGFWPVTGMLTRPELLLVPKGKAGP